jgi:hypothetical protein
MALLIIATTIPKIIDTLASISKVSYNAGFKFVLDECSMTNRNDAEIYISKHYKDEEEYFYLKIESESRILKTYDLLNLVRDGKKYFRFAITDQAKYDHLLYDFSLEYLRINPEHLISLYGEIFFSLDDMEKFESNGGYFENWCFK